ncbi:hypothetical protein AAH446_01195 [Erwinia sp. P6884]|uniref:hypothetical protein n=1 Tax=Erwinia sp. P6884 TaxID=3141450 RepID=UPI00318649BE
MVSSIRRLSGVLDCCSIHDLAYVGLIMQLQALSRKSEQTRKIKETYCKDKETSEVTIPDSWSLNQLQRNFIESMMDKTNK